MSQEVLPFDSEETPFDAIRHEDENGEYWLARGLAPLLGYVTPDSWKNFISVIERARTDISNLGQDSDAEAGKINDLGETGYPRDDYRLSRYGCYMVAMNGDYRKVEISSARSYFADRTRRWEIYQQMDPYEQAMMIARQMIAQDDKMKAELKATMHKLQQALPKAEEYDQYMNTDDEDLLDWFQVSKLLYDNDTDMGRNKVISKLRDYGIVFRRDEVDGNALPRKEYEREGWFKVRKFAYNSYRPQTFTTKVGLSKIYQLFKNNGDTDVRNPFSKE